MSEKYLTINAGSSSLKFSLYNMPETVEVVNGYIEKIGNDDSFYTLKYGGQKLKKKKIIMFLKFINLKTWGKKYYLF